AQIEGHRHTIAIKDRWPGGQRGIEHAPVHSLRGIYRPEPDKAPGHHAKGNYCYPDGHTQAFTRRIEVFLALAGNGNRYVRIALCRGGRMGVVELHYSALDSCQTARSLGRTRSRYMSAC